MWKSTESSNKVKVFGKNLQKFQAFWEKLQNLKVFGKIAKISSLWKKLQKAHSFG